MSQFPANPPDSPPPLPYDPNNPYLYYETPRVDNAARLVRLAVIFNFISVGLDGLGALFLLGFGSLVLAMPDIMGPPAPGALPPPILGAIYIAIGLFDVVVAIVKYIGTRKLQTGHPQAWGWGLAVGIIGCAQLLFGSCLCLQVAPGVYTIVILCMGNVKNYLASRQAPPSTADPPPPAF